MCKKKKKLSKRKTKKQSEANLINNIRNPFMLKKIKKIRKFEDRIIKDRIIRDIRMLFEEEEDYYKPKIVSNFLNNIYIKFESNGDINKNVSLEECLNQSKLYLRDVIIDLQNLIQGKFN